MGTLTIAFTVTDANGVVYSGTGTATQDNLSATATVTPSVAAPGTNRTLVVTPSGGTAPYTFGTPTATGITFTPVTGSPGQWTFVY